MSTRGSDDNKERLSIKIRKDACDFCHDKKSGLMLCSQTMDSGVHFADEPIISIIPNDVDDHLFRLGSIRGV